jgi:hypothetical protein
MEVFIALFVHDAFIRPYGGDVLATMLLYCLFCGVLPGSKGRWAVTALLLSYLIEFGQYVHLTSLLGLAQYRWARLLLGSQFAWGDVLAYSFGVLLVVGFKYARGSFTGSNSGPQPKL